MTQLNKLNTYNHGTVCMNAMHNVIINQRNDIYRVLNRWKYFHTHFKYQYIKAPMKVFNCNKQNRLTSHSATVAHHAF
jgi:disulfide oxidoreductase YuzD